jgi:AraC-like DNA-binding protein
MTTPTRTWSGTLALGNGIVSYLGPGSRAECHRHDAIQLVWSRDEPFRLGIDQVTTTTTTRCALIPSRQPHDLDATGADVAIVLVEPSGVLGRQLADLTERQPAAPALDDRLAAFSLPDTADAATLIGWSRSLLAAILGVAHPTTPQRLRSEVVGASRFIDAHLDTVPLLSDAARCVGISPRQLRRIFAADIGMPYRRYILWRRLRRALLAVSDGADLTTAAATAGFSDSAHFSRTFRQTFGLAPSEVLPLLTVVETDFPGA